VTWRWFALSLGVLPWPALAAPDCAASSTQPRAEGRTMSIVFQTQPARIKVGELFSLDATVCPKAAAGAVRAFRVDASMPEHRHGMNYQPSVIRKTENAYSVNGLMFHMPGRWQLVFEVDTAGGRERLLADYLLD
jgi:hypothetical protein